MLTVTVSHKGQIVIPADIRRKLGIEPGCQLDFRLEGNVIRAEVKRQVAATQAEDGYGMLVSKKPGKDRLLDFDVARAMRDSVRDSA